VRHAACLVLAAALAGGVCPRAQAGPFEAPVLSNPATGLHLVGKLVWLDLETTDLPGAKTFYRGLFGWNYRDYHAYGVDYTVALDEGKPIAGLVRRQVLNDTERPSVWLPFFSVADVGATFQLALKNVAASRQAGRPDRGGCNARGAWRDHGHPRRSDRGRLWGSRTAAGNRESRDLASPRRLDPVTGQCAVDPPN